MQIGLNVNVRRTVGYERQRAYDAFDRDASEIGHMYFAHRSEIICFSNLIPFVSLSIVLFFVYVDIEGQIIGVRLHHFQIIVKFAQIFKIFQFQVENFRQFFPIKRVFFDGRIVEHLFPKGRFFQRTTTRRTRARLTSEQIFDAIFAQRMATFSLDLHLGQVRPDDFDQCIIFEWEKSITNKISSREIWIFDN
uniref:Uncharacterized protein n=1 Tax=Romanomermis culicivorax TaxID=13658 RepID=A0A915JMY1_ROMCU